MSRLFRLLIVSLLLPLAAGTALARTEGGSGVRVGGWFSTKGSGVTLLFPHADGSYGELRVSADFEQVLKGREKIPGIQAQYRYNVRIGTVKLSDDFSIRPVGGPGISVGYVRDYGKDMGLLAALGGNLGLEFLFPASPLSIYAGFSAEIGAHIVLHDRYESKMTLYSNGVRRVWQPELSVRYRF